ncbi:hypothetical protein [Halobacillus massiliensis]|uniref:hypothetical protein n=1 Tax=Halobacillus massiliensis TaxID=1926286 RepID=UPI0009E22E8A|nr:hypothetical protein [Halobacillus massiliensis]
MLAATHTNFAATVKQITKGVNAVMNNKIIAFTAGYAMIMAILLVLTFNYNWNPSGYSYELNQPELIIKQGITESKQTTVNFNENMSNALLFQIAVSNVQAHWKQDLLVLSLFFPLILFSIFKEYRPFKEVVPYKWFVGLSAAVILAYVAFSIPDYVTELDTVERYVSSLLE